MTSQQRLQVSIHERLRRLLAASHEDASHQIRLVTDWINDQPALRAILAEAERADPDLDPQALVAALTNGSNTFRWPSRTEAGKALIIWQLMLRIAADDGNPAIAHRVVITYGMAIRSSSRVDDAWRELAERILRPLFDYLSECVGEVSSILYVLERYVRVVEWFDRQDLHRRAVENPRKAEEVYDTHLRRFLFAEGINMPFSQAKSPSGESDVLTGLDTDDPFVGEVKIYGEGRTRRNLAGGVQQALSYASDYGKQVAYLIIINLSGNPLNLPSDDDPKLWPPRITVAGTLVYLIAVRALPPAASASKQGKPSPVIVTRDDLVDPDAPDDEASLRTARRRLTGVLRGSRSASPGVPPAPIWPAA